MDLLYLKQKKPSTHTTIHKTRNLHCLIQRLTNGGFLLFYRGVNMTNTEINEQIDYIITLLVRLGLVSEEVAPHSLVVSADYRQS